MADTDRSCPAPQPGLKHHFDDGAQQLESSTLGMWVFLVTEIMFFGGMFGGYTIYRNLYPEAFASTSHFMNVTIGAINTAVLICSSFTMVLAVRAAQLGQKKALIRFLILTLILGCVFLGLKYVEYHEKWVDHHVPGPQVPLRRDAIFPSGADPVLSLLRHDRHARDSYDCRRGPAHHANCHGGAQPFQRGLVHPGRNDRVYTGISSISSGSFCSRCCI